MTYKFLPEGEQSESISQDIKDAYDKIMSTYEDFDEKHNLTDRQHVIFSAGMAEYFLKMISFCAVKNHGFPADDETCEFIEKVYNEACNQALRIIFEHNKASKEKEQAGDKQ
jgi:hypothetical protein